MAEGSVMIDKISLENRYVCCLCLSIKEQQKGKKYFLIIIIIVLV